MRGTYTRMLVKKMVEDKAPVTAREIGFPYDEGVRDLIFTEVEIEFKLNENCSIATIEQSVDQVIEWWKEDTKGNFPEQCSL